MGLQQGQTLCRQQVVRFLAGRTVQTDHVHAGQHLVQIIPPRRAQFLGHHIGHRLAVVIVHLHAERLGTACQRLTDPPHADDTQSLAMQFAATHPCRGPALELTVGDHIGPLNDPATDRQDQRHGDIGCIFGQDTRCVGHDNLAGHRSLDIDMVDTGPEISDQFQLLTGTIDQIGINTVCNRRHQHIGPLHARRQRRQIQLGVEKFAHSRFNRVGKTSG